MIGRRLPLVGRCALAGAAGFVAAALATPLIVAVVLAGSEDFPDSAFHPRTILVGALVGAVATAGLAMALHGKVRRALMLLQGTAGFALAGVLVVAHHDHGLLPLPLAGATIGVALALGAPGGVAMGALVGASTFSMAAALTSAAAIHPVLGVVGAFLGLASWGAALGATAGWSEETAARGRSWPALRALVLSRPAWPAPWRCSSLPRWRRPWWRRSVIRRRSASIPARSPAGPSRQWPISTATATSTRSNKRRAPMPSACCATPAAPSRRGRAFLPPAVRASTPATSTPTPTPTSSRSSSRNG